jgi:hypothetical protein
MIMEQTNKNMHREQSLVTTSNQARPGQAMAPAHCAKSLVSLGMHCTARTSRVSTVVFLADH